MSENAEPRLLFADELPQEPGLEDALVLYVAQAWTRLRKTARQMAPAAIAGGAWATAAAGQVSAVTVCQAATLCVLTVVGGSTLHYWQKSHSAKMQPQTREFVGRTEQAQPVPQQLADAVPPAAPAALQEPAAQAAAPEPPQPVQADAAAAPPIAAPAHALTLQEQLPLSTAVQDGGAPSYADAAPSPVAGAAIQRATIVARVPAAEPPAPDSALAMAAPKTPAPVHARAARLAMRSAPTLHAAATEVRVAPPVIARLLPPRHLAPRVILTRFDMPRWLMEAHATRPAVVMSAPPHVLETPHDNTLVASDSDHDSDHDSDRLNVPAAAEEQPARPALAVAPHRNRFAAPYGQPVYYPRPAYYPPAGYYQPYGYPYGPYGYGRY